MPRRRIDWLKVLTHLSVLTPLAALIFDFVTDRLGVDPVRVIQFRTGKDALVLLLLTLAIAPLRSLFGFNSLARIRRTLGVYAFIYICLHLLNFIWLDLGLDISLIYEEIFLKPYALVGFTVFILLIPLTVTSTNGWRRRLGPNWRRLHQLLYIAVPLDVIHFFWSRMAKLNTGEPLVYIIIAGVLLIFRIPWAKSRLGRGRAG